MRLQHNSFVILATSIAFYHIVTRAPFLFFLLRWLTFSVLGLLAVKKLLRKHHRDGQVLAWSSQVQWQEILLWVFHSTFWACFCISRAPFDWSLWSGHHWKDLFLLQTWSIDDANFGQKWWRQKWKKGQRSSRAVTGGTGVNGLSKIKLPLGLLNLLATKTSKNRKPRAKFMISRNHTIIS